MLLFFIHNCFDKNVVEKITAFTVKIISLRTKTTSISEAVIHRKKCSVYNNVISFDEIFVSFVYSKNINLLLIHRFELKLI